MQSLKQHAPNAAVYLDATHSHWLGVGEAAYRLYLAGFVGTEPQVRGFFLNASNYQLTEHAAQFGTWVSMCLETATADPPNYLREDGVPQLGWCQGQYNAELGYAVDYSDEYVAETTAQIQGLMDWIVPGQAPTSGFVIDTSRNGRGPLGVAPYGEAPYLQPEAVLASLSGGSWCNPPGRGVGLRPTLDTGRALLDAYLWIKIPGESDGSCDSAGGARAWDYAAYNPWGVPEADQPFFDPLWRTVDPAAGEWFPAQALELADNADPPLH